ncbi:MAG: FAD-dependent oxidoreductase, partial [Candidatus Marinimicrobia bacterium]|nr:FAD-dependent oxidoreductase [Candidatus Neomarinimicrobiota bacterium]
DNIKSEFSSIGAKNIAVHITINGKNTDIQQAGLINLNKYSNEVLINPAYQNQYTGFESIKTERKLTPYDCIKAPCIGHCATDQHIPQYIYHSAMGDFEKAFEVIMETNPLPGITGAVCDQLCALKCTRSNYDNPLLIRDIKRYATEFGSKDFSRKNSLSNKLNVAIIGGGPAGLSCAYFLALAGCNVEIFEAKGYSGGMVFEAIPKFRLADEAFQNDVDRILDLDVQIHYNSKIDHPKFNQLNEQFDYIYISAGAQKNKKLKIDGENLTNVLEPVEFLSRVKQAQNVTIGERVVVIGGGNTAMDAVRTAKRIVGKSGEVTILYRRTRKEMPAEDAEIQAALDEGVKLIELVSPLKINGNETVISITCQRMELGKQDASGRARPIPISNSEFDIEVDTIIPAIGQDVELNFLNNKSFSVDIKSGRTSITKIFAGGDAIRGAATVVEAVGDGKESAKNILIDAKTNRNIQSVPNKSISDLELQKKAIQREYGISVPKFSDNNNLNFDLIHRTMTKDEVINESARCLFCDEVCSVCVYVCPNLANIAYKSEPLDAIVQNVIQDGKEILISDFELKQIKQTTQIINIGDFCNECGNCTTFCPTAGDPYRTKPHFFLSNNSFTAESEGYYLNNEYLQYKNGDFIEIMKIEGDHLLYSNKFLSAILDKVNMRINVLHSKVDYDYEWTSDSAVQMGYLLLNIGKEAIFTNNE